MDLGVSMDVVMPNEISVSEVREYFVVTDTEVNLDGSISATLHLTPAQEDYESIMDTLTELNIITED